MENVRINFYGFHNFWIGEPMLRAHCNPCLLVDLGVVCRQGTASVCTLCSRCVIIMRLKKGYQLVEIEVDLKWCFVTAILSNFIWIIPILFSFIFSTLMHWIIIIIEKLMWISPLDQEYSMKWNHAFRLFHDFSMPSRLYVG